MIALLLGGDGNDAPNCGEGDNILIVKYRQRVYGYLQNNISTAGNTVAFTASGSTYVFQDDGINDTLVQLAGIAATGISTTGLATGAVWIA